MPQDWAREHSRNIAFYCASCNRTKREKPYGVWLDEQEAARLANEKHRASPPDLLDMGVPIQMSLEDLLSEEAGDRTIGKANQGRPSMSTTEPDETMEPDTDDDGPNTVVVVGDNATVNLTDADDDGGDDGAGDGATP
jgi:hypothetical protein